MTLAYAADSQRQCASKRTYATSRDAKRAARGAMATVGGRAMVVYRCPHCSRWHVGHPTAWRQREAHRMMEAM